jgi:hypothetical protein
MIDLKKSKFTLNIQCIYNELFKSYSPWKMTTLLIFIYHFTNFVCSFLKRHQNNLKMDDCVGKYRSMLQEKCIVIDNIQLYGGWKKGKNKKKQSGF